MVKQRHNTAAARLLSMALADKEDAQAATHRRTILGVHHNSFGDNEHPAPPPNTQLQTFRTLAERRISCSVVFGTGSGERRRRCGTRRGWENQPLRCT